MKICIVGAGAIGGYLGARLAQAGHTVTLIVRGNHLKAIQQNGLKLITKDQTIIVKDNLIVTDRIADAKPQEVVFITLKTHSLAAVALELHHLLDANTTIVTAQNGVPWWYFHNQPEPYGGYRIKAVDPDGLLEQTIDPKRLIGCVIYVAASLVEPGVVEHNEGDRFSLGELDGSKSERLRRIADALNEAGLKAPIRTNIRSELWLKLWGNLVFNPISALTGATLGEICEYPLTRELARNMMLEAEQIANKLGIDMGVSLEQRMAGAQRVGNHKTSMLQDVEAGRPTEADAIVGAVAELGRLVGVPTPYIDATYATLKLFERKLVK